MLPESKKKTPKRDDNKKSVITLPNGYQVSMIWHESAHCGPNTVETAIIDPSGKFVTWHGDDVQTFQDARDVARTLTFAASL